MSVAIYFGKINLISSQIEEVLSNSQDLRNVLSKVLYALNDDISYTDTITKYVDNEPIMEEIEYSLSIKEKNENTIQGYIHKKSYIYYKDFNKEKKEIIKQKIKNTESSEFFYDIYQEMVGYQRTQRFGYKEFLHAFELILNTACKKVNLNYTFTVNQFTEGLNIDDLKNELFRQKNIKKMKIKYQIPNPDSKSLQAIKTDPEKTINDFKSANLASKYVTYQSFSDKSLNIDSALIEDELQNINNIHSSISAEKALRNGYVEVETTNAAGITYSTADTHPVIIHVDNIVEIKNAVA